MIQIDDYVPARRYLAPKTTSLWRWDHPAADAVVWAERGTIAFREELLPVLARLAKQGLPPMNALVWLLGACRENWPDAANDLISQAGMLASLDRTDLPDWLLKLFGQLDAVHGLPAELRTAPAAKAELAAMVFEETRGETSPEDAYRIVRVLAEYSEPGLVASQPGRQNRFNEVLSELRLLHEGLKRFDADAFRLRFQTGLEQPIEAADIDLEPAERARQLIARLQDDEELGGVARIARQMLAAIQLPRAITDLEDLPVGGVSDISNRGPIDRLLLSELAHDDVTLAVRVAMNEALYLRRETPPGNPPKHRAVLMDSGVRLWGVPRVFATAVGMALAAGAQRNVRNDFFRAAGDRALPVSLTDRAGVISHLEILEPDAHPGGSLTAFAASATAEAGLTDAVIVTSEDVAADREFQQSLAALELPTVLLATVSREGRFRLVSRGRRGSKLLREATLELEKLLANPVRPRPALIDPAVANELPAIFSARPFPLLLSHLPYEHERAWKAPSGGIYSISKDRCLFHWKSADRGARLVSDRAPHGAVLWSSAAGEGGSLAVVGRLQQESLWLVRVDAEGERCESFPLDLKDGQPRAICGQGGAIFAIYPDRINVFGTATGLRTQSTPIPAGLSWRRDRFFGSATQWYALSYDGFKVVFEGLLSVDIRPLAEKVLTFVDVPEEEPVGIMDDGSLLRPSDTRRTALNHDLDGPLRLVAVSRWDSAVLISDASGRILREVSIPHRRIVRRHALPRDWLLVQALDQSKVVRPVAVRNRYSKIFVGPGGRLGLVARRSESVISLSSSGEIIMQNRRVENADRHLVAEFRPAAAPPGVGYSLQVARWQDGSKAWLDSRGMLHLKSSDRSIPEVTLVLHDGRMAGWTSQGWTFGMEYFAGETEAGNEEYVYQNIIEAFVALLL